MGTKWKNIKNNVRAFWLAHRTQILTGFLALLALALFLLLAFNYRRMNTRIVWSFGLAMNLIGAAALSRWFACHLQKRYAAWETLDEDFYEIWSARSQDAAGTKPRTQFGGYDHPVFLIDGIVSCSHEHRTAASFL